MTTAIIHRSSHIFSLVVYQKWRTIRMLRHYLTAKRTNRSWLFTNSSTTIVFKVTTDKRSHGDAKSDRMCVRLDYDKSHISTNNRYRSLSNLSSNKSVSQRARIDWSENYQIGSRKHTAPLPKKNLRNIESTLGSSTCGLRQSRTNWFCSRMCISLQYIVCAHFQINIDIIDE
jgi:hypothetical protein